MKHPISVIIHTRNSAKTLEKALQSVSFAQELVVIDMESSDNSVVLAKKHGANIFQHEDVGYVEPARMFGIAKASHEWILVLDADEQVQSDLANKIPQLISGREVAWKIPRKNIMFGMWPRHASWWPDYVVRLFRKDSVLWPKTIHAQPKVNGLVGVLDAQENLAVLHHNYESVSDYLDRINHYTSIKVAEKSVDRKDSLSAFFNEFFSKYFYHGGHKDGVLGLNIAMLQAMYESVLSIKSWEATGKKEFQLNPDKALSALMRDMAYWRASHNVQINKGSKRVYWQFRRKLKI